MKDFIKDLIIAIIIVVAISMVIKPTIVKERSMQPTLYENNYLFVNKLTYKFKDHPNRGDIIVFKSQWFCVTGSYSNFRFFIFRRPGCNSFAPDFCKSISFVND